MNDNNTKRTLGHNLARELNATEIAQVAGAKGHSSETARTRAFTNYPTADYAFDWDQNFAG